MLVFGPRDEDELEVVWRLVCVSYNWATATKDDMTPSTQSHDNRLPPAVMSGRSGPFWDAVEGRAPLPPAAATLGLEFIAADVEKGTIEVAFAATEAFTTPMGDILGGIPRGELYDSNIRMLPVRRSFHLFRLHTAKNQSRPSRNPADPFPLRVGRAAPSCAHSSPSARHFHPRDVYLLADALPLEHPLPKARQRPP